MTVLVPKERTVVFPAQRGAELVKKVCSRPPTGITSYWAPTEAELSGLEETLPVFLKGQRSVFSQKEWTQFVRQVVGVRRGEASLIFLNYVHFYPPLPKDWREQPYDVCDGGHYFFRVLYDLKTKRFVWYECNGK